MATTEKVALMFSAIPAPAAHTNQTYQHLKHDVDALTGILFNGHVGMHIAHAML